MVSPTSSVQCIHFASVPNWLTTVVSHTSSVQCECGTTVVDWLTNATQWFRMVEWYTREAFLVGSGAAPPVALKSTKLLRDLSGTWTAIGVYVRGEGPVLFSVCLMVVCQF